MNSKIYIVMIISAFIPLSLFEYLNLKIPLNLIIFLVMFLTYLIIIFFRYKHDRFFLDELDKINVFLKNNKSDIRKDINLISQEIKSKYLQDLWLEFKSGIIKGKNGEYYQSEDAEFFFNYETLISEKINVRLLSYFPQFFVGLGITGTFLGLAIGLSSLGNGDIFSQNQTIISDKMGILINGVSTSFFTSLYGLYYSIVFSVLLNLYLGNYQRKISLLKNELNYCFNRNLLQKSVEEIKQDIYEIKENNSKFSINLFKQLSEKLDIFLDQSNKTNNSILERYSNIVSDIQNNLEHNTKKFNSFENNFISQIEKMMDKTTDSTTNIEKGFNLLFRNFEQKTDEYLKNNTLSRSELFGEIQKENGDLKSILVKQIIKFTETNSNSLENTQETFKKENIQLINNLYSKLQEITTLSKTNSDIFISEVKQLNSIFKEALSTDLREIFANEFIANLEIVKNQIIEVSKSNNEMINKNLQDAKEINTQSKEISGTYKLISNKILENYEKVYADDYIELFTELKKQLQESINFNINNMKDAQTNFSQVKNDISSMNTDFVAINMKLQENLQLLLSEKFINTIKENQEANEEFLSQMNKLQNALKQSTENEHIYLTKKLQTTEQINNTMNKISDSINILYDKLKNSLDKIYSQKYLDDMNIVQQKMNELSEFNKNNLENLSVVISDLNEKMADNSQAFEKLSDNLKTNLKEFSDNDFADSINDFKENLRILNDENKQFINDNSAKLKPLIETLEQIDLGLENYYAYILIALEKFDENNFTEKQLSKEISDSFKSELNEVINKLQKIGTIVNEKE